MASTALAWVAFLLVNGAFIALSAYGLGLGWLYGLLICALYTAFLFGAAIFSEKMLVKEDSNDNTANAVATDAETAQVTVETGVTVEENQMQGTTTTMIGTSGLYIIVYLLYALGVIGIGVTTFIIPFNVFKCNDFSTDYYYNDDNLRPELDLESLPQDVQDFVQSNDYPDYPSFVKDSDHMFFSGQTENDDMPYLYTINSTSFEPEKTDPPLIYPSNFLLVNGNVTSFCFVARDGESYTYGDSKLFCSSHSQDKTIFITNEDSKIGYGGAQSYAGQDGLVWVKTYSYEHADDDEDNNDNQRRALLSIGKDSPDRHLKSVIRKASSPYLFSIEPSTMKETLHTTFTEEAPPSNNNPDPNNGCDGASSQNFSFALGNLFISAIPVTIASIILFRKKSIPSLPITTYIGLSDIVISIYIAASPANEFIFYKWWFSMTSALWIVAMLVFYFKDAENEKRFGFDKPSIIWSVNFASLIYFIFIIILTDIFSLSGSNNNVGNWILINVVAFLPLIFIGTLLDQSIVVLLGAIGLYMDAFKIANDIIDVSNIGGSLAYFLVFAISSVFIGYLGWVLNKHQALLVNRFTRLLGFETTS
jgi:hypothetical protein